MGLTQRGCASRMRDLFRVEFIMYAVIATGGKQYRVEEGSVLRIEKLTAEPGAEVKFDPPGVRQ